MQRSPEEEYYRGFVEDALDPVRWRRIGCPWLERGQVVLACPSLIFFGG